MNVGFLLNENVENDGMTESGIPELVNSLLDEDNSKHYLPPVHSNEELKDTEIFNVDEINEEDFDVNSSNTITVITLAPVIDCSKNTIVEGGDLIVGELTVRNVVENSPTHVTQKREKEEFQSGNSRHLNSDQSHSGIHVISDPESFTSHKIWKDNEDPGENNQASKRTNTVLTSRIKFHSAGNNMPASFIINENMPLQINSQKLMNSGKASCSIKEQNTDKSEISRKRFRSRGQSSSLSSIETTLKSKDSQGKVSSNLQQLREGLNSCDNNSFQFLMKTNFTNRTTKNPASNLRSRRSRSTHNNKKDNEFQESTKNNQPGLDTCVKELGEHKEWINTKFSFKGSNLKTAKTESMKRNPFNSRAYSNKVKSSTRTDINFHNLEVEECNRADTGSYRVLRNSKKVYCKGMKILDVNNCKLSDSHKVAGSIRQHSHFSEIKKSLRSYERSTNYSLSHKLRSEPDDSQECISSDSDHLNKRVRSYDKSTLQLSMKSLAAGSPASNLCSRKLANDIKKEHNKLSGSENIGAENSLSGPKTCNEELGEHKERINSKFSLQKNNSKITKHRSMKKNLTISRLYYKKLKRSKRSYRTSPAIEMEEYNQADNRSYRKLRSKSKLHCKGMNVLQKNKDHKLPHSYKIAGRVKEQHPDQSGIRQNLRRYGKSSNFSSTVREIKMKSDPDDSRGRRGQLSERLKMYDNNGSQLLKNNYSKVTTEKPVVDSPASNLRSRLLTNYIRKRYKLLGSKLQENGSCRILRSRSKEQCKGMHMLQTCKESKLSHSDQVVSRVKEQHLHQSGIRKSLRSYGKSSNFSPTVREIKLNGDPDDSQESSSDLNLPSERLKSYDNNGSQMLQKNKDHKLSHSHKIAGRVKEQHPDQSGIRKNLRSYGKSSNFSSTVKEIKLKSDLDNSQGQLNEKLKINDSSGSQFSMNNSSNTTTVKPSVASLASNLHSRQSLNNIKKKHNKLLGTEFQENGSYRILRSRSKVHGKGMNMLQVCKDSKLSLSDKVENRVKEQHPHQSGIRKSLRSYGKSSNFSPTVREIKSNSDPDDSQESSSDLNLPSERLKSYDNNGSHFSVKSSSSNTTSEIQAGDSPASNLRSRLSKNNIGKEHTELSGNEFHGSIENIQPGLEIFNEKLEKHKRTINTKFSLRKKISTVNGHSMTESRPVTRAHYSKLKSNSRSKCNVPIPKVKKYNQKHKKRALRSSCKVYCDRINITQNENNGKLLYLHKAADGVKEQSPDNCGIRESFKSNGQSSNFSFILTGDKLESNPDDSQKHTLSESEQLKKRLSYDNNSSQLFMQCKESKITYENTLAESPSSDVQSRSRNIGDVNSDSSGIKGKNEKSSNILPVGIENNLRSNILDDEHCSFSDSVIFHKHDRPEVSPYLVGEKLNNNHRDDYEALDSPISSREEISNDNSTDNCASCITNSKTSNETSSINRNDVEDEIIEYDTTSSSFEANNSECNSEENSSESNPNNQLEHDGVADDQTCSRSEAQEENTLGSGRLVKLETRSGYVVTLTVDQDRPSQFRDDKARKMWDRAMDVNMARMMAQIETGQYLSEEVQKQIEAQKLARELERDEIEKKMKWYQVEASMLDVDVKIKRCLNASTSPHKVDQCLNHLETLYNLNIQPLMLKKFSFVFDTIRALQRYAGSEEGVQLREREKFKKKVERIRSKANDIYKKFKDLYPAPENEEFSHVFASILEAFQAETQNIDLYSLVEDPQSAEE